MCEWCCLRVLQYPSFLRCTVMMCARRTSLFLHVSSHLCSCRELRADSRLYLYFASLRHYACAVSHNTTPLAPSCSYYLSDGDRLVAELKNKSKQDASQDEDPHAGVGESYAPSIEKPAGGSNSDVCEECFDRLLRAPWFSQGSAEALHAVLAATHVFARPRIMSARHTCVCTSPLLISNQKSTAKRLCRSMRTHIPTFAQCTHFWNQMPNTFTGR